MVWPGPGPTGATLVIPRERHWRAAVRPPGGGCQDRPTRGALTQLCQVLAVGCWAGHREGHLWLPLYKPGENRSALRKNAPEPPWRRWFGGSTVPPGCASEPGRAGSRPAGTCSEPQRPPLGVASRKWAPDNSHRGRGVGSARGGRGAESVSSRHGRPRSHTPGGRGAEAVVGGTYAGPDSSGWVRDRDLDGHEEAAESAAPQEDLLVARRRPRLRVAGAPQGPGDRQNPRPQATGRAPSPTLRIAAAGQHADGLAGPGHPQLLQIHGGHGGADSAALALPPRAAAVAGPAPRPALRPGAG